MTLLGLKVIFNLVVVRFKFKKSLLFYNGYKLQYLCETNIMDAKFDSHLVNLNDDLNYQGKIYMCFLNFL